MQFASLTRQKIYNNLGAKLIPCNQLGDYPFLYVRERLRKYSSLILCFLFFKFSKILGKSENRICKVTSYKYRENQSIEFVKLLCINIGKIRA